MQTRLSKHVRLLSILCWAALTVAPQAPAQTPLGLNLQLYAGLSITGAVGTVYAVEYVTDLAQTNSWRCLEFLQLPASPYLWTDKSAPATGRRFYRAVVFAAPTDLVFIPPGTFRMGSPTNEVDRVDNEGPQTAVTISRGFWMGKHEVTQGEYLALIGSNPSHGAGEGTNLPVEQVSWFDATNYCGKLTQRERAAGRIATNSVYRLPTEAEWEYACRAWTSTRFSYGDDPGYTNLTNYAWYGVTNVSGTPHPVGQKQPNQWGLYDMHGNVWEWCQDWYDAYASEIAIDPQGHATGSYRVLRGGAWGGDAGTCRSAYRGVGASPLEGFSNVGFRIVLAPGQTQDARSLYDLLFAVRWREPGRLEVELDSPDGITEQSLGIPLDANFNPIPNATSLFPSSDRGMFPLTDYRERRELVMTIEHRNAAVRSYGPAVSTDPTKRYALYRAMQASMIIELHDNTPMATPPPGAVYYVWRVWRGWSYWQVFEGDTTTFTTDVAASFLTWTGSLNSFKSAYGIRGTEGGRGLLPLDSNAVIPRGYNAIPANFRTQGPDAVMMVEYRQIPNTQTTDGPIAW